MLYGLRKSIFNGDVFGWIVKLNAVNSGHFSFKLRSPEVLFQTPVEQIENLVSCVGNY